MGSTTIINESDIKTEDFTRFIKVSGQIQDIQQEAIFMAVYNSKVPINAMITQSVIEIKNKKVTLTQTYQWTD